MIARRPARRWPFAASAAAHALALLLLASVTPTPPIAVAEPKPTPHRAESSWITHLVFLPSYAAPSGGGGGGGRQPPPIRRAEAPGSDRATLRIARRVTATAAPIESETPVTGVLLDATPLASGTRDVMGLPEGGVTYGTSTGPGSGGGVGTGTGTGIGSGTGPGIGPGIGGGFGEGVYRIGGGVSPPALIKKIDPSYPPDALRDRIQGSIVLELVVTSEGMPADIRVVRALSPDLDRAAISAVREWRFRPGRLGQRPVNVLVTVILDFSIH